MMIHRKFSPFIPFIFFVCVLVGCGGTQSHQITPTTQSFQQAETQVTPTPEEHLDEFRMRPKDGMREIYIPEGKFQMGSGEAEIEDAIELCQQHYHICNRWYYERESPLHSVSLDGFWIDQSEISNAQYRFCVDAGVCPEPTTCKKGEPSFDDPEKANYPVVCVNWEEAQNYCQWVGARLPTEAEWEYAYRGEDGSIYSWGDEFDGTRLNYCDRNCSQSHQDEGIDDGYPQTAPVRSFPSGVSWSGLYNMSGNVSEWVEDWLGDYSSEALFNPLGPSTGTEKMIKGCSWFFHPTYCRGAARHSVDPDTRTDYLGFRCASGPPITSSENPDVIIVTSETISSTVESQDVEPITSHPTATAEAVGEPLVFVNAGNQFEPVRSWDVALGDLDGDGDMDAVTSNDDPDGMKIWFNDGGGLFIHSYHEYEPASRVVLGDLDLDKDLDIVCANWDTEAADWLDGHRDASVWLNDGTGYFSKSQEGLGGEMIFNLDLGDFNGDGSLDIFFIGINTNTVWLNDGTGSFLDSGQRLKTGIDAAVVIGDLDSDGDLDALTGGWDSSAKVWLNDGKGNFANRNPNMTGINLHIHGLSLGDLDGDGDLDAFAALANGGPHEVWFNEGDGSLILVQKLSAPLAQGVSLGDIDSDGDLDAVTAHGYQTGGHVQIWLNDGFGSFTDSQLRLGDTFSSDVALGDLDTDSNLDIFAAHTDWHHDGHGESDQIWLNEKTGLPQSPPVNAILGDGYLRTSDGMNMSYVPAGNFHMGSSENDPDSHAGEYPQHEVTLDSFWIDHTEVTNTQYKLCVDSGLCRNAHYTNSVAYNGDDHPAVGVDWGDAVDYCAWAGGRLPTEAEWEYAAKGVEGYLYPWGDVFDGNNLNFCDQQCSERWADPTMDDGYRDSAPIGSYPEGASWVGALDLAGNVWEWVWDWYADYTSDSQTNPEGPENGTHKIIRGGAWASPPEGLRTSYRIDGGGDITPTTRHPNIGFRCVVPVNPKTEVGVEMESITVPLGFPPEIDGTMSPGEWDGALTETFADGSELLLLQADDYLYLGIRANTSGMIAGNIFIHRGDEVAILHSSAALGTAIYQEGEQSWQQIQDFTWRCRNTSSSESTQKERAEFLQAEDWLAANGLMGTPNELEYQIKISDPKFRLSAVYIKGTYPYEKVPWPADLDDDCILPTPGGLPEEFYFSPKQWGMLELP